MILQLISYLDIPLVIDGTGIATWCEVLKSKALENYIKLRISKMAPEGTLSKTMNKILSESLTDKKNWDRFIGFGLYSSLSQATPQSWHCSRLRLRLRGHASPPPTSCLHPCHRTSRKLSPRSACTNMCKCLMVSSTGLRSMGLLMYMGGVYMYGAGHAHRLRVAHTVPRAHNPGPADSRPDEPFSTNVLT